MLKAGLGMGAMEVLIGEEQSSTTAMELTTYLIECLEGVTLPG